jgi:hypothetical protein
MNNTAPFKITKFSDDLKLILASCSERTTIKAFLKEYLGQEMHSTLAFFIAVFSFFACIPKPPVGIDTALGFFIIIFAFGLFNQKGIEALLRYIPERFLNKPVGKYIINVAGGLLKWVTRLEFLFKPRLEKIFTFFALGPFRFILHSFIIVVGFLVFLPLPIPFIHIIPAFIVFLVSLSIMQRDGLLLVASFFGGLAAIFAVYYFLILSIMSVI